MSCGCAASAPSQAVRTRAAMCETCPHAVRGVGLTVGGTALLCGAADPQAPVVHAIVGGAACPDGRHPGEGGVLVWRDLEWYGVPYPLRLWLRLTHPKRPAPGSFDGCGCLVRLKDAWSALARLFGVHIRA